MMYGRLCRLPRTCIPVPHSVYPMDIQLMAVHDASDSHRDEPTRAQVFPVNRTRLGHLPPHRTCARTMQAHRLSGRDQNNPANVSDGSHPHAGRFTSSRDRLSIKGHPTEDAVICTADKTYTLRSVALSNTVLVVTPSRTDPDGTVHVRDQLHEVLELVPSVPKLHKLSVLLRGMEYDEGDEDRRVSPRRRERV